MKHYYILISLIFIVSCGNAQEQKISSSTPNKELIAKVTGEWTVTANWANDLLVFERKKDKETEEEEVDHYNTIVFNTENQKVEVNSYGLFMCGTAASQNLKMFETEWLFIDGQLSIKGKYSDYSGEHAIDNKYDVERKEETLLLKKIKKDI